MPKIDKLLVLLELMYNRPVVPLKTIQEACRVSERTAYRYIGSLIDANFPIEYDFEAGGYRILGKASIASQLTDTEACIVYFGTLLLEQFAGEESLDSIKSTRVKIESKISEKLQQVLASGRATLFASATPPAIREFVVMSLLLLAARLENEIRLSFIDSDVQRADVLIRRPRIVFDREWAVTDQAAHSDPVKVPIRLIHDIEVGSLDEEKLRAAVKSAS